MYAALSTDGGNSFKGLSSNIRYRRAGVLSTRFLLRPLFKLPDTTFLFAMHFAVRRKLQIGTKDRIAVAKTANQ